MILDFETGLYFVQAASNVDNVPPAQVSSVCPACKKSMAKKDNNDHLVYDPDLADTKGSVVVIVSCENRWILDPIICGLPVPEGWEPYDAPVKKPGKSGEVIAVPADQVPKPPKDKVEKAK